MSSLVSDDFLRDAFNVEFIFSPAGSFNGGTPVLTVRAIPAMVTPQSHAAFASTIWFKGSRPLFREADDFGNIDLDEIDPHDHHLSSQGTHLVEEAEEDDLFARAAEIMENCPPTHPVDSSTPFIVPSTVFSQQTAGQCTPPLAEWDAEIPSTPTSISATGMASVFDDLWL